MQMFKTETTVREAKRGTDGKPLIGEDGKKVMNRVKMPLVILADRLDQRDGPDADPKAGWDDRDWASEDEIASGLDTIAVLIEAIGLKETLVAINYGLDVPNRGKYKGGDGSGYTAKQRRGYALSWAFGQTGADVFEEARNSLTLDTKEQNQVCDKIWTKHEEEIRASIASTTV